MSEIERVTGRVRGLTLLLAGGAAMLTSGTAAAQQAQPAPSPPPAANTQIGPPQLRDFQLQPRQRLVTQPAPAPGPSPTPPPAPAPAQRTPPSQLQPAEAQSRPAQRAPASAARAAPGSGLPPAPRAPVPDTPAVAPVPETAPLATQPTPTADFGASPSPAPVSATPPSPAALPAPAPLPSEDGFPLWLVLLGGLGLGLGGYTLWSRRRSGARRGRALPAPGAAVAAAAPRAPRPDPVPRPWLEIELKPERTTADPEESIVEFEMTVRNSGGSAARDIKLQAKLICSTPEQDKEITAFHRKKPGEHRTLDIPDLAAGQELVLKGRVDVKREELKALRVEQRLLFVPLVAVNAFYGFGTGRTGQTSKSFLVGRERADRVERMAPFRLDLGPRVYRTLGQRPYKIERRV